MIIFLINLGDMYVVRERFQEAEAVLLKALYINPKDVAVYPILGFCYNQWSKYDLAENILEKGISLNREDPRMYLELYYYKAQGKIEESLKLCDYIEKHNSNSGHFLGIVAAIYRDLGRYKEYNLYLEKINKICFCYYNPIAKDNYLKLKNIILNRGIKLICVQYPMRKVEHLKNIFNSTEGIIFVDNEKVFKKAVSCSSYEDYFRDIFAGDFGHCTKEGNRLLADNIVDSLLSNYFKY